MSVRACDDFCDRCHRTVRRKARKKHTCCACKETIPRGHVYEYFSGINNDGDPWSHKRCLRCCAIAKQVQQHLDECDECDEWDREYCQYDLNCGHVWHDAPTEVARLAFMTPAEAQELTSEDTDWCDGGYMR